MGKRVFTGILFAILILSILFISRVPHRPVVTILNKEFKQQKKSNFFLEAGYENPGEFARLQKVIRTRDGEEAPGYEPNYRIKELLKARKIVSTKYLNKPATNPLPWVERGPGNVSGRTRGLIVDPDDPTHNTWFAGSVSGGIWKTTNAGLSWENKTPNLPNLATTVLVMAESNHDVIYAGTGEGFFNIDAVTGSGIWKSMDRGETWEQILSTAENDSFENVNRMVVHPNDENVLLAATNRGIFNPDRFSGIFRSTDGGNNWKAVFIEPNGQRVQQLIANPRNFNTLFATVNGVGIIKSTDAGVTWNLVWDVSDSSVGRIEMAISPVDTNRIYAAVENFGLSSSLLYMSEDNARSWVLVRDTGNDPDWLGGQGWYDNTIAVHPFNPNIVFVGGINLWKITIQNSLNGKTRTTQQITQFRNPNFPNFVHVDHHNLLMIPINASTNSFRILDANDGGVFYSLDGGNTWRSTSNGYNTTQFYGVDKNPIADEYFGGMQDNGSWQSPPGQPATANSRWLFRIGGDGFNVVWNFKEPNKLIGGFQFNGLFRSNNSGRTFQFIGEGIDRGSGNAPFVTNIASSKSDTDLLFVVGKSGVWRSDTFGLDWTLIPIEEPVWSFNASITQVEISLANPQIVWAGARMNSKRFPDDRLHVSTDGGITFKPVNQFTDVTLGVLTGLATHPTEDSTAYALFSFAKAPKILRTTDLGQTWEDISGFGVNSTSSNGFPDVAVYSLLVMPFDTNILWAGTEIGIFESTDNGATWHLADNGLPAVSVWEMKIVNDQVVVATHGRGIWSVTLAELAGYHPPVVTLSPRLNDVQGGPGGRLFVDITLRSSYDSSFVMVEGNKLEKIPANDFKTNLNLELFYSVEQKKEVQVSVISYKDGQLFKSISRKIVVFPLGAPMVTYTSNFNQIVNDFILNGFQITRHPNFRDGALHSMHPYPNSSALTAVLKIPIQVASENAILQYEDIALVEPGIVNNFKDPNFFDFVVVEGSDDFGKTWKPLLNGYDARFDSTKWLPTFQVNGDGDSTMFITHEINLLNTFPPGDEILIRFRLNSDAFVTGWGWVIDNLKIQESVTAINQPVENPRTFSLSQNYPNPFNPTTVIRYSLPEKSEVTLTIFNIYGQRVKELIKNQRQPPGNHSIKWDGRDQAGHPVSSGVYFYRLKAGRFVKTMKMTLIK
ncbi:MAG: T9SS C-terminal target domain-containing protein [Calditrichaeota bacterium]|nr:MAG: T9SS C-terminal target domain-containing protein [Calditrichota bacterium]